MKTWLCTAAFLIFAAGCGQAPAEPAPAAGPAAATATVTPESGSSPTPAPAPAPAPVVAAETVEQAAEVFYKAWTQGDTKAMQPSYAPLVTLLPGCEMLKGNWGISADGDRSKSLVVKREKLIEVYETFIAKVSQARWVEIFGKLPFDKVTFHDPAEFAKEFPTAEKGDVLMLASMGHGDDVACFVWRQTADKKWQIVMELTDY